MANLVNLERVSKSYGVRPLLSEVSLGVGEGERIGIVGRNGDGKTTLLEVLTGALEPDGGRVSQGRGLHLGYLHQQDQLQDTHSVREAVLGGRADHEWAADPRTREVVEELLAGISLDRAVLGLSGGERRRCSLAALLLDDHDLLVLDEPTNHLDVEAVAWLAAHLASRASALVVVTHDRWFLDAVCQLTWEVHDGVVDAYEGGYAAFVLAKAERQRQAAASEVRRQNLVRKELAWLRRGPPARTSKPKFRIDAANSLIDDVPPPRDRLALERFATQRLGKDVVDLVDVDLVRGERTLLSRATWRLGPGDRVGLVGVNGAGKTSVLALLAGELAPTAGKVKHGRTLALQHLTQAVDSGPEGPRSTRSRGCSPPSSPCAGSPGPSTARCPRRRCSSGSASPATASRPVSATCPVASDGASSCSCCCSPSPTCCSSTSRPTTWTSRRSTSWRTSSTTGPARSSSSRTTATSSNVSATRPGRCSATGRSRCCLAGSTSTSSAVPPASPPTAPRRRRSIVVGGLAAADRRTRRPPAAAPPNARPARPWPASTASSPGSPSARRRSARPMALASDDYERLAELAAEHALVAAEREVLETEWLEAAEILD